MREVSGPIIAIALVLCAVFVPMAFLSGVTGQFYKQFAVTIAISTVISAINSLTLSPALAALLLKPHGAPKDFPTRLIDRLFGWIFRPFNRFFHRSSTAIRGWWAKRSDDAARCLWCICCCSVPQASCLKRFPAGLFRRRISCT
jgi:multidrug efflux pump